MTSSATSTPDFKLFAIQNTSLPPITTSNKPDPHQTLLLSSVLDLFGGFPTKRKLSLWTDDAVFVDPLTIATGRKQYEGQWYGLKAAFSDIQRLDAKITRIEKTEMNMELKTRYKVKGIGSEQTIDSLILVKLDDAGQKITRLEDRWNGDVPPEGAFAKAMRNLNSVAVPVFVSVPKSIEEEESKMAAGK